MALDLQFLSGRIDRDEQIVGSANEGQICGIETDKFDNVSRASIDIFSDRVIARADAIEIGIAAPTTVDGITTTTAVDRIGVVGAADRLGCVRAPNPGRTHDLTAIPARPVRKYHLFDAGSCREKVTCDRQLLTG